MIQITIDREKRLMLLKWLKQGYIDSEELGTLNELKNLTREEIETELDKLAAVRHDVQCERLQRLGYCKYKATNSKPRTREEIMKDIERINESLLRAEKESEDDV